MKRIAIICLLTCMTLTGCGNRLLERSYSSVTPHSAAFWENEDADTLRAENYQDLVNALLLLLGEHSADGVVRFYGDAPNMPELAGRACVEVQKETPIGAYLLDYITYDSKTESGYTEISVHFGYRRTAEEQNAIVNASSIGAIPDLLRAALREGRDAVTIRVSYVGSGREDVFDLVAQVRDEAFPAEKEPPTDVDAETETKAEAAAEEVPEEQDAAVPEEPERDIAPWQVVFYPDEGKPGIIEVLLLPEPEKTPEAPAVPSAEERTGDAAETDEEETLSRRGGK